MMMTLEIYAIAVTFTALASAFVLLLLRKQGAIEYMQVHGGKVISELANCNFCLSFWANLFLALILCAVMPTPIFMTMPIFATPITRILL